MKAFYTRHKMPLPKTQKIFMSNATLADDAQASGTIQFVCSRALARQASSLAMSIP